MPSTKDSEDEVRIVSHKYAGPCFNGYGEFTGNMIKLSVRYPSTWTDADFIAWIHERGVQ